MVDAFAVQSRADTDTFIQGDVSEDAHPDAGRGCVGYAHLAHADDVASFFPAVIHHLDACIDGFPEFFLAHGCLVEEVAGAPCDFPVEYARMFRQVVIDSHVDDAEVEAVLTAEHVYAAATACEVNHLLPGHFARTDADTLALDAVVAAEQQVAGM